MSQEFIEQLVWSIVKRFAFRVKMWLKGEKTAEKQEKEKMEGKENIETIQNGNAGLEETTENIEDEDDQHADEDDKHADEDDKPADEDDKLADNDDKHVDDDNQHSPGDVDTNKNVEENVGLTKNKYLSQEVPVEKQEKESAQLDTAIFFHFTLFLLWSLVAALSIPSVLTWAHNFK